MADHRSSLPASIEDPFDDLLNLEESYYRQGYDLGLRDGRQKGLVEGRVFGMEKAFERFLEMGRMHGRAVVWASRLPAGSNSGGGAGSVEGARSRTPPSGDDGKKKSDEEDRAIAFLPAPAPPPPYASTAGNEATEDVRSDRSSTPRSSLPSSSLSKAELRLASLGAAPRLAKHVRTLWALTEPESIGVANEEDLVSDFDDRFKRAVAKVRIISRMVGEDVEGFGAAGAAGNENDLEPGGPRVRSTQGEVGIEDIDILKVRH